MKYPLKYLILWKKVNFIRTKSCLFFSKKKSFHRMVLFHFHVIHRKCLFKDNNLKMAFFMGKIPSVQRIWLRFLTWKKKTVKINYWKLIFKHSNQPVKKQSIFYSIRSHYIFRYIPCACITQMRHQCSNW